MKYLKKNWDVIFKWGVLSIFLVFNIVVLFNHELWRDEAQAWLISRDLSFVDIIKQMQYEGHPCLWHLVLMPFAKLGLPCITVSIISLIFMFITAYLILTKSPFNKIIKALIVFSPPFMYYFSINSRPYCLIALIITLLGIYYKDRINKPYIYCTLLALLINTHVLMIAPVAAIFLVYATETLILGRKKIGKEKLKKIFWSCFIVGFGVLILYLQIYKCMDTNIYVATKSFHHDFNLSFALLLLYEQFLLITGLNWFGKVPIIFIIIVVMILLYGLLKFTKQTIIIIISLIYYIYIHTFWFSVSQKAYMIIPLLFFCLWTYKMDHKIYKRKGKNIPLYVLSFLLIFFTASTIPNGINKGILDIKEPMTGSLETSEYISKNLGYDAIMLSVSEHIPITISAYDKKIKLFGLHYEDYFTFVTWNSKLYGSLHSFQIIDRIKRNFKENDKLYLIYTYDDEKIQDSIINKMVINGYLKYMFASNEGALNVIEYSKEKYVIYKVTNKVFE